MKITLITETFLPSKNGVVTRLTATIRWLLNNGHEVQVIAPDQGVTEFEGARVDGVPSHSFFLYKEMPLSFPHYKLGKLLKAFDPDLVHVVNPAALGVAGVFYTRMYRYPLICSYHTHVPKYADFYRLPFLKPILWWYFRTLHNRAILNLCTSATVQAELSTHGIRNVHLWSRGVDLDLFNPRHRSAEMRSKLTNGRPDRNLLLYVGRLAPEKHIEKIRNVLLRLPDCCLAIVGDGPYRAQLESYFAGTNTVFTGYMQGETLAQAYASSDTFVFPSTTETLGLVLLEAMASGLPVVAARSGPTSEQVEDGVNGFMYNPDDPDSLAETIEKLKNPDVREQTGRQAHQTASKLGWSKPSEQLYNYYAEMLEHMMQEQVKGI